LAIVPYNTAVIFMKMSSYIYIFYFIFLNLR